MKKKNNRPIPSAGPSVSKREVQLVADAARIGWYENRNNYLEKFIKKYSSLTRRRYVLPTAHCTDALHLALKALRIGKGDEVIVPDITWIAPAAAVTYTGARPIFADIEESTWCLSPESFEKNITKRTKAVIIVDLYGGMPRMRELLAIAKKHRIPVVEDAAEALGSSYRGRPAGSFGDISVMSFNATKFATAGQGGVFATNDKTLYERAGRLIRHGMVPYTPNRTFWSEVIGYNYEWTNMQAAFALGQLERLPELLAIKRRAFREYKKLLSKIPGITLNPTLQKTRNNNWLPTMLIDRSYRVRKERILEALQKQGIGARPFFYPMSSMPAFKPYVRGNERKSNPVSYDLSSRGVSLPSAYTLTASDTRRIVTALKKILKT